MKALRLVISQSSANYKKEETDTNKMTYPLPPISTVIGAIHAACGYKKYVPMDISIQGKYESLRRKPYTDYCFLNSLQDDRGILVRMANEKMLSNAFVKVAEAIKKQGNSFRYRKTIKVYNQELLNEYQSLKDIYDKNKKFIKEKIEPVLERIKKRLAALEKKLKSVSKESYAYKNAAERKQNLKKLTKDIKEKQKKYEDESYVKPISRFRSLTKSLKYYEILDGVRLIIHVKAGDCVLNDILKNIYNLRSIGRSEDVVIVENAEIIDLQEDFDDEVDSKYSAYIDINLIKNNKIFPRQKGAQVRGTKYYLNKNYEIKNEQRIFNKKQVLYTSMYSADEFGDGLYLDNYCGEALIVNFL